MMDVYCPYCDEGIDIDDPEGYYINDYEECECPHCERIFVLFGEPVIEYSAETVKSHYGSRIRMAKGMIDRYEEQAKKEPEKAEYAKLMIDTYYQKDLEEAQRNLIRTLEHNNKAKPLDD